MKLHYAMALLLMIPVSLISMHRAHRRALLLHEKPLFMQKDLLEETKGKLSRMGNIFDPEPTDPNAPLDEKQLMTDFYVKLKNKSPQEIQEVANKIVSLKFTDNGRALYRHHAAALVMAGADPNTVIDTLSQETLLQEAAFHCDYALCELLLKRKANPNQESRRGTALFLCRTAKVAQLLLDHEADPKTVNGSFFNETLLHHAARCSDLVCEVELIPLYRSCGVSVFTCDGHNGTPIHALASSVSSVVGVEKDDIKRRLDALLQGLTLSQKKALLATASNTRGIVFDLLEVDFQENKGCTSAQRKIRYLKALLQSHLSEG